MELKSRPAILIHQDINPMHVLIYARYPFTRKNFLQSYAKLPCVDKRPKSDKATNLVTRRGIPHNMMFIKNAGGESEGSLGR